MPHSSAILPPSMRWDEDDPIGHLPAARRKAHNLPSIVGGVHDEAGNHLVALGYLVLDYYAGV